MRKQAYLSNPGKRPPTPLPSSPNAVAVTRMPMTRVMMFVPIGPSRRAMGPAEWNVRQGIGSTDHVTFIRAGMLGFNPIQDYDAYDVREHHTNVDTAERIREEDVRQNAVILTSFVLHAANRAARLPSGR